MLSVSWAQLCYITAVPKIQLEPKSVATSHLCIRKGICREKTLTNLFWTSSFDFALFPLVCLLLRFCLFLMAGASTLMIYEYLWKTICKSENRIIFLRQKKNKSFLRSYGIRISFCKSVELSVWILPHQFPRTSFVINADLNSQRRIQKKTLALNNSYSLSNRMKTIENKTILIQMQMHRIIVTNKIVKFDSNLTEYLVEYCEFCLLTSFGTMFCIRSGGGYWWIERFAPSAVWLLMTCKVIFHNTSKVMKIIYSYFCTNWQQMFKC